MRAPTVASCTIRKGLTDMDLFKVTRKQIEFTPNIVEAVDYPPVPVKFNLPEWYKKMDTNINGIKDGAEFRSESKGSLPFTIKRCVPVSDFLTSGYMIKTFADIFIYQNESESPPSMKWFLPTDENNKFVFGTHPHSQCPIKFDDRKSHYGKFFSGWRIKTPPGYSCIFYQNFYAREDRFVLFPAIVDTDTYDATIAFPGYFKKGQKEIKIEAGTPLVTALPFKRDDWQMKLNKEVFHDEKTKAGIKLRQHFENVYRNFFHAKKKFD